MRILRRRNRDQENGAAATAVGVHDDFEGTDAELDAEIARLAAAVGQGDRETERRLLALRHEAGIRALAPGGAVPAFPQADTERLPDAGSLPEFQATELTPGLVRAAILRDGFILVRGLVDRKEALRFADLIDRAFAERELMLDGGEPAAGYYEEFVPATPEYEGPLVAIRPWIRDGGGVLAVDSPMLALRWSGCSSGRP